MGKVTQSTQKEPEPPAGNGLQYLFTVQSNPPLKETNFFGWRETSTAIAASKCPKPCTAPARLHPGWVLQPHAHACVCGGG